MLEINVKKR